MSKIKTGAIYSYRDNTLYEIVNVDNLLLMMSVRNHSIMLKELTTKNQYLVSAAHLELEDFKYLGDNPVAAQILYGSTTEEQSDESTEYNNRDFDPVLVKYDKQDY